MILDLTSNRGDGGGGGVQVVQAHWYNSDAYTSITPSNTVSISFDTLWDTYPDALTENEILDRLGLTYNNEQTRFTLKEGVPVASFRVSVLLAWLSSSATTGNRQANLDRVLGSDFSINYIYSSIISKFVGTGVVTMQLFADIIMRTGDSLRTTVSQSSPSNTGIRGTPSASSGYRDTYIALTRYA